MWRDVGPYLENYVSSNSQAPYIIARLYQKYLAHYEEYFNGGHGTVKPGVPLQGVTAFQGAPIGEILTKTLVSPNPGKVGDGINPATQLGNESLEAVAEEKTQESQVQKDVDIMKKEAAPLEKQENPSKVKEVSEEWNK